MTFRPTTLCLATYRRATLSFALALAVASVGAPLAAAQTQAAGDNTLRLFVESAAGGAGTRVEVTVGELDPYGRLAPCLRMEPFLPAGARLWGRGVIGVRCVEGANWTTTLPVQVRIWGRAAVAARPLAAGDVAEPPAVVADEVELTRDPPGALADLDDTRDKVLLRAFAAGQPIRRDALRARPVVAQGDQVKLVYRGEGFTITADARALAPAADGQRVRVQTTGGRMLTGVARPGRVVEFPD